MRFTATLEQSGRTATGLEVPTDVVTALGSSRRPAVTVTLAGHTYRSSVASMGGRFMLPVSAEIRGLTGIAAGDRLDVDLELDTVPREVEIPADLADALSADPAAKNFFEGLSYSNQRRHVLAIEQARTAETRGRRIEKALLLFRDGRS